MKDLLKFLFSTIFVLSSVFLVLSLTIKYKILNSEYLIDTLDRPGIYEDIARSFRESLKTEFIKSFEEDEKRSVDQLSVGEKAQLNEQINEVVAFITAEIIKDFTQQNIVYITSFINGQSEKLYLYIPLKKWGASDEVFTESELLLLTEQTDIQEILPEQGPNNVITKDHVRMLKVFGKNLDLGLRIATGLLLLSIFSYSFLFEKAKKLVKIAWLFVTSGFIIILMAGILKILSDSFLRSMLYWKSPLRIAVSAVVPPFAYDIVSLWFFIGGGLSLFGLVILAVRSLSSRKKVKKNTIQPLAT